MRSKKSAYHHLATMPVDLRLVREVAELDLGEGVGVLRGPVHHGQVPRRQDPDLHLSGHFLSVFREMEMQMLRRFYDGIHRHRVSIKPSVTSHDRHHEAHHYVIALALLPSSKLSQCRRPRLDRGLKHSSVLHILEILRIVFVRTRSAFQVSTADM